MTHDQYFLVIMDKGQEIGRYEIQLKKKRLFLHLENKAILQNGLTYHFTILLKDILMRFGKQQDLPRRKKRKKKEKILKQ